MLAFAGDTMPPVPIATSTHTHTHIQRHRGSTSMGDERPIPGLLSALCFACPEGKKLPQAKGQSLEKTFRSFWIFRFFVFFGVAGWPAGPRRNFGQTFSNAGVWLCRGFFLIFVVLWALLVFGLFFLCFFGLFGCGFFAAARAKPFEMLGFCGFRPFFSELLFGAFSGFLVPCFCAKASRS